MIKKEIIQWPQYVMCPSVVVYAVDHIVAPSLSNNTRKICIWICAWKNYLWYTLVCVHFIVCSMYVSSCSTPSFSCPSLSSPSFSVRHFPVLQIPVLQIQLSHGNLHRTLYICTMIIRWTTAIGTEYSGWYRCSCSRLVVLPARCGRTSLAWFYVASTDLRCGRRSF